MTAEVRQLIRLELDRRARLLWQEDHRFAARCVGCGCAYTDQTDGCKTCAGRVYGRRRYRRPEYRERDREARSERFRRKYRADPAYRAAEVERVRQYRIRRTVETKLTAGTVHGWGNGCRCHECSNRHYAELMLERRRRAAA